MKALGATLIIGRAFRGVRKKCWSGNFGRCGSCERGFGRPNWEGLNVDPTGAEPGMQSSELGEGRRLKNSSRKSRLSSSENLPLSPEQMRKDKSFAATFDETGFAQIARELEQPRFWEQQNRIDEKQRSRLLEIADK